MKRAPHAAADRPSLEALAESGLLPLESLHPGGLALTADLAALCDVKAGTNVLDVACGTGETACFLADQLSARVVGLDRSDQLLSRARAKVEAKGLAIEFWQGDAANLPFPDAQFDVALCECTLCLVEKVAVLEEMTRVVRPGGRVGMHDLFWANDAPDALQRALAEGEGEEPETAEGWRRLFAEAGLTDVCAVDKSDAKRRWMRDARQQLGFRGQWRLARYALHRWGWTGVVGLVREERLFSSAHLGYGIVVGTKPVCA